MQKHIVVSSPKSAVKVKTVVTPRGLALWLVEILRRPAGLARIRDSRRLGAGSHR